MSKRKRDDASMRREESLQWTLRLWQVLGWCVTFLPVVCCIAARHEQYFRGYTGLKVSGGVIAVLVVSLIITLRKAKLPGRVVSLWICVAMVWMLIPLLQDLLLLLFLLAIGATLDRLFVEWRVRKIQRELERQERREDIRDAVESAIKNIQGDT